MGVGSSKSAICSANDRGNLMISYCWIDDVRGTKGGDRVTFSADHEKSWHAARLPDVLFLRVMSLLATKHDSTSILYSEASST